MLVEDRARALSAGRCLLEGDDPERPGGGLARRECL